MFFKEFLNVCNILFILRISTNNNVYSDIYGYYVTEGNNCNNISNNVS